MHKKGLINAMDNWKLAYAHDNVCRNKEFLSIDELIRSGYDIIDAGVPGNFEKSLTKAGRLPDLYFGTNVFKAQDFEDCHVWYFTSFDSDSSESVLHFNGIDAIADIYLNGELIGHTENMFIEYDFDCTPKPVGNELIVHIHPARIEAKKYTPPAECFALPYNFDSLYIRKAPHMYGWDIMPRIVSCGIWKSVKLFKKRHNYIKEAHLFTLSASAEKANLSFYSAVDTDTLSGYTLIFDAVCGDSSFSHEIRMFNSSCRFNFDVENPALWWPKNYGEQNLYNVKVTLKHGDEICDTKEFRFGIRTVRLDKTDTTDGSGEFCFRVNGKKIFILGTNWVPLDAFHSNDKSRLPAALALLDDIGCNAVRCWGGNVYEPDEFFNFCDEKGILVWQDFAMACAGYPQDEEFIKKISEEAIFEIKRLRNHASLALFAGDNECDEGCLGNNLLDPNANIVTRKILPELVRAHAPSALFLPSSPYISPAAFETNLPLPEAHLWGPRDYFKGDFYKNSVCHFASETGYHGCPSPKSLEKFLENPDSYENSDGTIKDDWLAHAACPEPTMDNPYSYRIKLMESQVDTLFGSVPDNMHDFAKQSQISQAEAKKYFIERFRLSKWRRSGIIWWNLIDGWPQISDAVVDYYYTKKLAYHYIRRSQQPICLMFDEPQDGKITLYGVNDLQIDTAVSYRITDMTCEKQVACGIAKLDANISAPILSMPYQSKHFYLIEWDIGNESFKNHYFTDIIDIDYDAYLTAAHKCGFDEFEDF